MWKKKTNKLQVHPYKPVSWSPPDEWAITKQACRDELVVCLFFSSTYIYDAVLQNTKRAT